VIVPLVHRGGGILNATTVDATFSIAVQDLAQPLTVTWTTPAGPKTGTTVSVRFSGIADTDPAPQFLWRP
jgi:hypothetical protein